MERRTHPDPRPERPVVRGSAVVRRRARLVRKYVAPLIANRSPARWSNLLASEWHRRRGDAVLSSLPPVVLIDPTNACNLGCPLCPTGQRRQARPVGLMSFDLYRGLIDEVARRSYKVVLHNWGEPLLHPRIADMVSYATERGLATEMSSNLTTLPDALLSDLVRARLTRLVVSVDGATQESYESYRRGGDLAAVHGNLARLAEAKRRFGSRLPTVEVQTLVMRGNEHELEALRSQALGLGADRWEAGFVIVNTLDPSQVSRWLPTTAAHSRYDLSTLADRLNRPGHRCSWLWRSTVINWDGTVCPCCNFDRREAELGDLKTSSLSKVWNGEPYQNARRLFRAPSRDVPRGPLTAGEGLCSWCRGVPRAQSSEQQGVY